MNYYDLLISKYLDNEISTSEKEELTLWLKTSKENEKHFLLMARAWEKSIITYADKAALQHRLTSFLQQQRTQLFLSYRSTIGVAVAICIILLSFHIFKTNMDKQNKITTIFADKNKLNVTLPDNSIVWLNKNSKISFPKKFKDTREVTLNGEAFFDVTNNTNKPFFVHTENVTIEVLGTRFLLTERLNEIMTKTILESGKINLTINTTGEKILVSPNQKVTYNRANKNISVETVIASDYASWFRKNLTFENTRLESIFTQLEKWYNLKIVCENDTLLSMPVSFTVDDESVEEVLDILRQITPLRWKKEDDQITIY